MRLMEVITKVNFSPSQDSNALQDMGALLDSMESKAPMRHGDVVEGQLMRIDPDGILKGSAKKDLIIKAIKTAKNIDFILPIRFFLFFITKYNYI